MGIIARRIIKFSYKICASGVIILAASYGAVYLGVQHPKTQYYIQDRLNQQLPVSVHFDALNFKWHGIYPGFSARNVQISRLEKPFNTPADLEISEVHGYFNLPLFFWKNKSFINELSLVGTQLSLETDDFIKYHVKDLPQFDFSFDEKKAGSWIKHFRLQNSDVIVKHPKQNYVFTQTDILLSLDQTESVLGHATYISERPCFLNFRHYTSAKNNEHHWTISAFGSLDSVNDIIAAHNPELKDKINVAGDVHAIAKITQTPARTDLYVQTNVKSFAASYNEKILSSPVLEATLVGQKTATGWNLATKALHVENVKLNDQPISSLEEVELVVDYQKQSEQDAIWHVQASHLPVVLIKEAKNFYHDTFPDFDLTTGIINYLDLKLQSQRDAWKLLKCNADVEQLSARYLDDINIAHLSGLVTFEENKGRMSLNSKDVHFSKNKWFGQDLVFDSIDGLLFVENKENKTILSSKQLNLAIDKTDINAKFELAIPYSAENKNQSSSILDLVVDFENLPVASVKDYLPTKVLHTELNEWLSHSLQSGTVQQGAVVFRGALHDFPFDKAEGIFQVNAHLVNMGFKFSPDWPQLDSDSIDVVFRNRAFYAQAGTSMLMEVPIQKVEAVIPDLTAHPAVLRTQLSARSQLPKGVDVINHSPLKEKVGSTLNAFDLKGDMALNLDLIIPLSKEKIHSEKEGIKVKGTVDTQDAELSFQQQNITVKKLRGQTAFTENTISAKHLVGDLWGLPSEFSLNSELKEDSITHIHAKGLVDVSKVLSADDIFRKDISGVTEYSADFHVNGFNEEQSGNFVIYSDLKGVELALPAPFEKKKDDKFKIEIQGILQPDKINHYMIQSPSYHLALSYNTEKAEQKEWLGGHLYCGTEALAKLRQDKKFLINGSIDHLDAKKVFDKIDASQLKQSKSSSLVSPIVDLTVQALDVLGLPIKDAKIEAQYDQALDNFQFYIQSEEVTGFITVPNEDSARTIVVDLEKVIIPETFVATMVEDVDTKTTDIEKNPLLKKPLEIRIKHLNYKTKIFKSIHAQLEPTTYGYHIKNFDLNLMNSVVQSSGYWHYLSGSSQVDITGTMNTNNISTLMNALGMKGTLKKAKGNIDFALSWEGYPFDVKLPSLSGEIKFNLRDGVIQGLNPGFGRILSLLNIDNIRRRLNLDFSDVTKEGMTFDSLSGSIHMLEGIVHSDRVLLESASVKIETTLRTSVKDQYLNGHLNVMPNLTGSLPIAAAIAAGNPAVGAAVWVMDKLFGKQIQEINRYEYRLMGTWENPKIEEMNVNKSVRR
ncbi:TIGR02099 family protein [Candidatus Berkiella cookevillensis]|uniref:TIGR02099 family protein n=1 Tax=Candidatus Berkiella cookevillensis TaxID=437022 RepID=A0AAE3L4U6_9GAMM|nr:YhdP family protein [Candidatus Berkiella cookevillensis]MCS5709021.1 TIGR02099 family protein [Candidatus Berkiella cookevillensis]